MSPSFQQGKLITKIRLFSTTEAEPYTEERKWTLRNSKYPKFATHLAKLSV